MLKICSWFNWIYENPPRTLLDDIFDLCEQLKVLAGQIRDFQRTGKDISILENKSNYILESLKDKLSLTFSGEKK